MACATLGPLTSFAQQYQETDQVANAAGHNAQFIDPRMINPWGIARNSTGTWWVAAEDGHVAILFNGEGIAVNAQGAQPPLVVTIPHAAQGPEGGPAGIVFNGSSDFDVEAGNPAKFIFASLFVADVHEGKIRVFDKNFHEVRFPAEAFDDDRLPGNFVPFNVQNIGGHLYVAFAAQNQAKDFVVGGAGRGAVDVFTTDGRLLQRFETGPLLDAPWGIAQAPTDFGSFSHSILVGQFGSGQILAFDAITGQFQGQLRNQDNNIITIPGLWGIAFGAGNANSGGANQLFFNAGINRQTGGLHGFLAPVPGDLTQGSDQ